MRASGWLTAVVAAVGIAGSAAGWVLVEKPHLLLRMRHGAIPMAERYTEAAYDYETFRAGDTAKVALWSANDRKATKSVGEVLPRVVAIPRRQHLLVVAENWCPDAANSVPYLARLAAAAPNVDLKLLRKADAPDLLSKFPLGDRQATPLVIVMDSRWQVRGVWIEQPDALRARVAELRKSGLSQDSIRPHVKGWYAADSGRAMLSEIVDLLEGRRGTAAGNASAAACGEK